MPYGWIFAYIIGNICMSAVAMSLRWANRGPWASCLVLTPLLLLCISSMPLKQNRNYCWKLFKALMLLIQSLYRKNKWKSHFLYKKKARGIFFEYTNTWRYFFFFFLVWLIYLIFFGGMVDILYIFRGVNTRYWGQAYVADKIQNTLPGVWASIVCMCIYSVWWAVAVE